MSVKTYSKKADGNTNLSANFKGYEFACKDGSDKYMVDPALVLILQKIRDHFKVPVVINSAYRTAAHNKKVNGSPTSRHLSGMAADIVVQGVTPLKVCQYAESIGVKGVGQYGSFVHVDTRPNKSFWIGRDQKPTSSFGGTTYPEPTRTLRYGAAGNDVRWVQQKLGVSVDGKFGAKTEAAVKAFQKGKNIAVDGVVGPVTRGKLR